MTVWLLEQISGIISSMCIYNTLYTVTLGSNKKPQFSADAANVCHWFSTNSIVEFLPNPSVSQSFAFHSRLFLKRHFWRNLTF